MRDSGQLSARAEGRPTRGTSADRAAHLPSNSSGSVQTLGQAGAKYCGSSAIDVSAIDLHRDRPASNADISTKSVTFHDLLALKAPSGPLGAPERSGT